MTDDYIEIDMMDAVECRVSKDGAQHLQACLSYPSSYWKPGKFRKERVSYRRSAFHHKYTDYWYFYTGYIPRIVKYLDDRNVNFYINGEELEYKLLEPHLDGIQFREDQLSLIRAALDDRRGMIQAPTGTGKTILQLGLISCLPKGCRALILAHTIGIVEQTVKELLRFNFPGVRMITGKTNSAGLHGNIVVSTMQSFVKFDLSKHGDYFDMVIVDEAHHVSRPNGTYAKILSQLLAPFRLGFTATMPTSDEAIFTSEGLLGPLIAEQTIHEAADLEILAKPRIRIIKSNMNHNVREIRHYQDKIHRDRETREIIAIEPGVYTVGIVNNRQRNRMIIETADEYIKENKSVLILITRLEHGENLVQMCDRHFDFPVDFVRGETESEVREHVKDLLIRKDVKCVIASAVWREGINIPTLDVVINACGGKSEIMTLQAIGRGLRKTEDKDEVVIVDIFDPSHRFLISHFGERMSIYCDQGWV